MPIRGELNSYGSLLAKVNIKMPKSFTFDQLQFLKKIFSLGKTTDNEDL
jgi:hypothetical protein